jgi:polyhydroxybutyrate depolymerase
MGQCDVRRVLVAVLVATAALVGSPSATNAEVAHSTGPRPRPSDGCDTETNVGSGEEQLTLVSNDVTRTYFRHVPPSYDAAEPLPLVVDLHGYLEGATIHKAHSRLGTFGDEHGFITLTPEGSGTPVHWEVELRSPDVKFIGQLLDEAEQTLCVDTRRIFVAGFSNGAIMSSILACSLADRIAAVAPIAGIRDFRRCRPDRPMPIVAFHGTEDQVLSFDGGLGPVGLNLPTDVPGQTVGQARPQLAKGKSIPDTAAAWAKRNGCKKKPTPDSIAADVTMLRYSDCDGGAAVELYEIIGGGHSWPGSEFSRAIESVIGPVTFSIDANELMWDFFQKHPLKD